MRELRSTANAFFWFALFVLGYTLVVPPPEGTGHGSRPRFLRMVIEDTGTRGHGERVSITVPWFLFRSGLHAVSARKLAARGEPPLRRHGRLRDRPGDLDGALRASPTGPTS